MPSYLLQYTRHRGRKIADNAGNCNGVWGQVTVELVVRVPSQSAQRSSGVCLTGTWTWKFISLPQTVASLQKAWDHSQLKLLRKMWRRRASSLLCKLPCVSKYEHSLLHGICVVLYSPGTWRARTPRQWRTGSQDPWQEHCLPLESFTAFLDRLKHLHTWIDCLLPRHIKAVLLQHRWNGFSCLSVPVV